MKRPVLLTLTTLALAPIAAAQDGKVQYEQLCGACHGNDGQGANQGQFPPLADSAWIKGAPDRMIQVVLHGLMGEITVPSKHASSPTYNLVMPPQGSALTDEQIAAITTYVRASWGNKLGTVTVAMVKEQREATKGRPPFWQANEILAKYPLVVKNVPDEKPLKVDVPIKDLLSYVYTGSWNTLPDWSKLKAQAVEEEHKGLISSNQAGKSQNFGLVWEGKITAPKTGNFSFRLDSDDASRVLVNDKKVAEINSNGALGRATTGSIQLNQGEHKIRIEYYNQGGPHGITLGMNGPGLKGWLALSEAGAGQGGGGNSGSGNPIYPLTNEAVIYRNFIEGTTPRGIGVGYHGGVNLAFSADNMSIDLLWTGLFMDGKKHWSGRGQGNQPPAGQNVIKVNSGAPFAILDSQTSVWPDQAQDQLKPRFHGYKFNARQEPTFFYTLGELKVEDKPQAVIGGNKFGLQRAITITADAAPANVHFRAAAGMEITELGQGRFDLGGQAILEVGKGAANRPYVRNKNELLIPLQLKRGENILNLRYTWK